MNVILNKHCRHIVFFVFAVLLSGCSSNKASTTKIEPYEKIVAQFRQPSTWGTDFGNMPTEECQFDSVSNVRELMYVSDAYTIGEYENTAKIILTTVDGSITNQYNNVSDVVKQTFIDGWSVHEFEFRTNPEIPGWYGYSGYLVAEDGCIIFAEVTFYEHG